MFTPSSFTVSHSTINGRDSVSVTLGPIGLEPVVCFKGTTRRDSETAGEFTARVDKYVRQLADNLNAQIAKRTPTAQTAPAHTARLDAAVARAAAATTLSEIKREINDVADAFCEIVGGLVASVLTADFVKKMEEYEIVKVPIEMSGAEATTLAAFNINGTFAFLPKVLQTSRDKSPEARKALLGSILSLQELMISGPIKSYSL